MKARIQQLIAAYTEMLGRTRSKIRRDVLENVIEDLQTALREAQ